MEEKIIFSIYREFTLKGFTKRKTFRAFFYVVFCHFAFFLAYNGIETEKGRKKCRFFVIFNQINVPG